MNKIYIVIWNAALSLWVVSSELGKGKKKSTSKISRLSSHLLKSTQVPFRDHVSFCAIATAVCTLLNSNSVYAISSSECTAMGASCVQVSTPAQLQAALNSTSTASTILLTSNITIPTGGYAFYLGSNRPNLVIDGGGVYGIKYTDLALNLAGTPSASASISVVNMDEIISTNGASAVNRLIFINNATANVSTTVDNVNVIPDGKLVAMGPDSAGFQPNKSPVIIGNINEDAGITFGAYRQTVLGSNITFTGRFHINELANGGYPAVLWTNDSSANSVVHLTNSADVAFQGTRFTNGQPYSGLVNANNYSYIIDDGAKLSLQMGSGEQNLFGSSNNGLQIGSYNINTGFGTGAILNLLPPSGNGISNQSSTDATSAIYNGPTSNADVVYNLAPQSVITVSGSGNAGILATKSTGTGNIYIRSGANISDGTENITPGTGINVSSASSGNILIRNESGGAIKKQTGISVTDSGSGSVNVTNAGTISSTTAGITLAHNGSGVATLVNNGTITSTVAGLNLSSTVPGALVTVKNDGGQINASGGNAINIDNNTTLNFSGGVVNLTGAATGLSIGTTNNFTHSLTGTIFNLSGTGHAVAKGTSGTVSLSNNQFNASTGAVFNSLNGIEFLQGGNNNIINLTGSSTGITSTDSVDLSSAYLTINVNDATATGISTSGTTGGGVVVGVNTIIQAVNGASAIAYGNDISEALTNNGIINGLVSMGGSGNTIVNNNTMSSLTSGSGADTLTLNSGSVNTGIIDLGDGDNTVNINDGATINKVATGSGNDTFNIYNLTEESATSLGTLFAGEGDNTLNLLSSTRTLGSETTLQNFSNINITDQSHITLNALNNISSGRVNIDSDNSLSFGNTYSGEFDAILNGAGDVHLLSGSNVTLGQNNTLYGSWLIDSNGILNSAEFSRLGAATVSLSGILNIANGGAFNNKLIGDGNFNIDGNGSSLDFSSNVGNAFTGTMSLSNVSFNLAGLNSSTLVNAALSLNAGSNTTVGGTGTSETETLKSLAMNGGTLNFTGEIPLSQAESIIKMQNFTATGGTINVNGDTAWENTVPVVSPNLSILEQNRGTSGMTLINADTASGAANLTLTLNGETPSQSTIVGINQNADHVADGVYSYGLSNTNSSNSYGLYLSYGLHQINLLQDGENALVIATEEDPLSNRTLTAQLTGEGGVVFNATKGELTVANSQNNYTGSTTLTGGKVLMGADNVFGNTSLLAVNSDATMQTNGFSQTVGELVNQGTIILDPSVLTTDSITNTGVIDIAGGTLNIQNGGSSSSVGGLTGPGIVNVNGGLLTLSGANDGLSAAINIAQGATLTSAAAGTLGSSATNIDGLLNLDASDTLENKLSGNGVSAINADINLLGDNSLYSGQFDISQGGTLIAHNESNLGRGSVVNAGSLVLNNTGYWEFTSPVSGNGNLVKEGSGTVHIGSSLVSAGITTVQSGSLLVGTTPASASSAQRLAISSADQSPTTLTSNVIVQPGGTFGGDGQVTGNVTNAGNLVIGQAATGNGFSDFVINGNYTGNGGNITLNTVLADDNSPTDRLVITGDTSGSSNVTVNNIGGIGAKNNNGIQVIKVDGQSAGSFSLNQRAQAGVLEYFLYQGTPTNPSDGSWYLRSNYQDKVITYSPESASFIANIAAAKTLFNTRLADLYAGDVRNPEESNGAEPSTLWLRQVGSHNKFKDTSGQLSSTSNNYTTQLGGELFNSQFTGQDRFAMGVMAGYARAMGSSRSNETNYKSHNSLTGYSVGIYGTWYADQVARHSPYIHSWIQYNWFHGSISSSVYDSGTYHLQGLSSSLEGGYPFQIYQGRDNNSFITPQVQFTVNGVKMNDIDNNGSLVKQNGNINLQTRIGARLSNDTMLQKETSSILTTYLDINWIQNSRRPGVTSDSLTVKQAGENHLAEVKVGAEGQLNKNTSIWGNLTQQFGQHGYDDKAAMLGVKYRF